MIVNCPECFRPFVRRKMRCCPDCVQKELVECQRVIIHLRIKPNSTVDQLSEDTEVAKEKILRWMQEGKIQVKTTLKAEIIVCLTCDKLLRDSEKILFERTGRQYCVVCLARLSASMRQGPTPAPPQPTQTQREKRYGLGANR